MPCPPGGPIRPASLLATPVSERAGRRFGLLALAGVWLLAPAWAADFSELRPATETPSTGPAAADTPTTPSRPPDSERWHQRALEQLDANRYRTRREAFLALWQRERPSLAAEPLALREGSPAATTSQAWLQTLRRLQVESESPGSLLQDLGLLRSGDIYTLRQLAADGRWEPLIALLELLTPDQLAQLQEDLGDDLLASLIWLAAEQQQDALIGPLVGYLLPLPRLLLIQQQWTRQQHRWAEQLPPPKGTQAVGDRLLALVAGGDHAAALSLAQQQGYRDTVDQLLTRQALWPQLLERLADETAGARSAPQPRPPTLLSSGQLEQALRQSLAAGWTDRPVDLADRDRLESLASPPPGSPASDAPRSPWLTRGLLATGAIDRGIERLTTEDRLTAVELQVARGLITDALRLAGLESLEEAVFSGWLGDLRQAARQDTADAMQQLQLMLRVAGLLHRIGHRELASRVDDAAEQLGQADASRRTGRHPLILAKAWVDQGRSAKALTYLTRLHRDQIPGEQWEQLLMTCFPELSDLAPPLLEAIRAAQPDSRLLDQLQWLDQLSQRRLPSPWQDAESIQLLTGQLIGQLQRQEASSELLGQWLDLLLDLRFARTAASLQQSGQAGFEAKRLARLADQLHQPDAALEYLHMQHARRPTDIVASLRLADRLESLGDTAKADRLRNDSLALPMTFRQYSVVVGDLVRSSYTDQATAFLELAIQQSPLDTGGNLYFAYFARQLAQLIETDQPKRARQLLQASLMNLLHFRRDTLDPVIILLWNEAIERCAARIALQAGDRGQFLEHLRRAWEILPERIDTPLALLPIAEERFGPTIVDEAAANYLDHYRQHLSRYPDDAMVHNNLAWMLANLNRQLPEALEHARRATELVPQEATYMDTLAEVKYRLGDQPEAVKLTLRCLQLRPQHQHFHQQLYRFTGHRVDH
jgi:tetratricopeptide (TPR) repeat protein